MNVEWVRKECLSLPMTTEDMPFGNDTLVFRLHGKIFCLLSLEPADRMNLKADPEQALAWREAYPQVQPGYHMNKKHWNTVYVNREIPDKKIIHFIHHSYELVVSKLPKKEREALREL